MRLYLRENRCLPLALVRQEGGDEFDVDVRLVAAEGLRINIKELDLCCPVSFLPDRARGTS